MIGRRGFRFAPARHRPRSRCLQGVSPPVGSWDSATKRAYANIDISAYADIGQAAAIAIAARKGRGDARDRRLQANAGLGATVGDHYRVITKRCARSHGSRLSAPVATRTSIATACDRRTRPVASRPLACPSVTLLRRLASAPDAACGLFAVFPASDFALLFIPATPLSGHDSG
jgi:hypothetical protein